MEEIKKCPFCGAGGANIGFWPGSISVFMCCNDCNGRGPQIAFDMTKDDLGEKKKEALDAWNKRAKE